MASEFPSSSFFTSEVRLANVLDELAVDMGLDLRIEIVAEDGLHLAGDLQRNTGFFATSMARCVPLMGAMRPRKLR